MEESQKIKNQIADMSNPFFQKVYWLKKEFPNDTELGNRVRNLVNEIEEYNRQIALKKAEEDIQKIITNHKDHEKTKH